MSTLSIKVSIAGRTYPLTIQREEEEVIRRAAKNINDSLKTLEDSYAVKDKQDLLAMTAIQMAVQLTTQKKEVEHDHYKDQLLELDAKLSDYINQ